MWGMMQTYPVTDTRGPRWSPDPWTLPMSRKDGPPRWAGAVLLLMGAMFFVPLIAFLPKLEGPLSVEVLPLVIPAVLFPLAGGVMATVGLFTLTSRFWLTVREDGFVVEQKTLFGSRRDFYHRDELLGVVKRYRVVKNKNSSTTYHQVVLVPKRFQNDRQRSPLFVLGAWLRNEPLVTEAVLFSAPGDTELETLDRWRRYGNLLGLARAEETDQGYHSIAAEDEDHNPAPLRHVSTVELDHAPSIAVNHEAAGVTVTLARTGRNAMKQALPLGLMVVIPAMFLLGFVRATEVPLPVILMVAVTEVFFLAIIGSIVFQREELNIRGDVLTLKKRRLLGTKDAAISLREINEALIPRGRGVTLRTPRNAVEAGRFLPAEEKEMLLHWIRGQME